MLLLSKGLNDEATLYYAQETVTKGWNRDLLLNAIKLNMYETQALARVDNNFDRTLPAEQAQYANEVFSSSYNLGFLGVTSPILELELEERLVKAITRFLMELGNGFTFIGNQHVLEYNGKESKVDMLFFHRGLRCLVAVDLKIGAFKPEYAGKMNYYLLKSATKPFNVLIACTRPLITELSDKLRLIHPLLPTISPYPTMRLEAIRSIIPISCRRYPKSV